MNARGVDMNILITGGAGFIGSNLVKEFVDSGHTAILLDVKERPENNDKCSNNAEYYKGDVRDNIKLGRIFQEHKINGVIHLAAVSRVIWGEQDPRTCIDVNINGTRTVLDAIKKSNQKPWIIFGSSREVYGEPVNIPVCEDCTKKPINIYGVTKIAGEYLVRDYSNELGLGCTILRFSNVYGDEKDILDRVIPKFIIAALKGEELEIHGGDQVFDFTHIKDTISGITKAANMLENNGVSPVTDDLHILTGYGTTLQDIVKIISRNVPEKPKVSYKSARNYDVERFVGDPGKAKKLIDFQAMILPEEGIASTIDRFMEVFNL
jgi:nucleoside-diphosphate-sugar epimerase